jgi:hypothetical protein
MTRPSEVPNISVQLLEFSKFENTITAKLRFTNSGSEKQSVSTTHNSYLINETTQKTYWITQESNPGYRSMSLDANGSIEVWAKYAVPETENPPFLSLALPNGVIFDHLEVK